jgi:hypothetical protein
MAATARALMNRENAQASTGPKTEIGKAASRMNALGHGLASKTVVLPHEDRDAYEALHRGFFEAHKPANDNEKTLVEHVAQAYWRLQRCYAVENAFLENRIAASDQDPEAAMASLFIDKAESARMRLLMRYLGSAERAYNKALSDLHKAQAARRKQAQEEAAAQAIAEMYSKPREADKQNGFVPHAVRAEISPVTSIPQQHQRTEARL